jgi:two-component system, cell cycle response regulator
MRILIIDDSPDALAVAKARLAHEGHEILCAGGGCEGLEVAGRESPDLILLDVDMPDLNGFDVCRRLKADAGLCMVPVIFLSGSGGPEEKVKGLDIGAVDFVTKPFDAFELRARVNAALRTKQMQDLLIKHAKIDPLTGLPNRRALDERLAQEWARVLRHGGHLSVIMADIDHFKNVNDQFGHPAGDEVLRQVARLLVEGCRESDMPARYGGEEFVVVAPEATAGAAADFAERLRTSICARPLEVHGQAVEVTASFGVADHEGLDTPEEMIQAADQALYRAKNAGRNCVKASHDGSDEPVVTKATS